MHGFQQPPATEDQWAARVRSEAQAQWTHDPAGGLAGAGVREGSPEFFARVEAYRYREQPWMHDTFRFERFAGRDVLEIGVGLGTDHLQLARAGARLTGVDLTPSCVALTERRFALEGRRARLEVMDVERLDFPEAAFDVVYSFGVLHHVPSSERAFQEVHRVLRPGGVFVGALYNRESAFFARILLARLALLQFRRESLEERLARVEYSTSDAEPHIRLFSAAELRHTLIDAGFSRVALKRRHLGLPRLTSHIPVTFERALGRRVGWYLVHEATV